MFGNNKICYSLETVVIKRDLMLLVIDKCTLYKGPFCCNLVCPTVQHFMLAGLSNFEVAPLPKLKLS